MTDKTETDELEIVVRTNRDTIRYIEWEDYPRSVRVAARVSDTALSALLHEIQVHNEEQ